jgi:hypothetical protein
MTFDDYETLPPEEKEHFARCSECGEIFDRRSLDEVLFHATDHKIARRQFEQCAREQPANVGGVGDSDSG